ncbi:MAG TPA: PAS domain S-box protein [Steroidobacteraceae bacterium]|nr:PAS domain S-box protein [Steroidobacteraceae bacterium]
MTTLVVIPEAAIPSAQHGGLAPLSALDGRARRVLGAFSIAVGCSVLLTASVVVVGGWAAGVDALKSIVPGFSTMKVNTAIALGALGGALALTGVDKRYRPIGNLLAGVALIVGLLTLAEYAFAWNAGIDQLWFKDSATSPTAAPGRPAMATAVMTTLLAASLLGTGRAALAHEKTLAAVMSLMIAWATLTGYLFGPQALHEVPLFSSVALHTAVLMLLLGLGVLAVEPLSWPLQTALTRSTGGVICRWLLPPALLAPPMLGWLLSRQGVLDFLPTQFDWAVYSTASTFGSVWLILSLAHRIAVIDAQRSSATELSQTLHDYSLRLQHTAEQLRVSEQRYRSVLEDQSEVISRYSSDRTLLFVNDAFCRLVGRPRDSLVGHHWGPIPLPEDLPMIERELARLSPSHPVVTIENRIRAADGRIVWMQFVNRAFFDESGRLIETQSVGRDVTERRELQDQLLASAHKIQDLYDSAPCGYHSLAADGTYVRINATELGWIGCQRDEVVGKLKPTDFFTAAGRAQFAKNFPEYLRTGGISDLEYDLVGRNGQIRRVSVSATAVRDASGAFKMSRGVMFDVTERERALEALRTMTENLEQRVAERTAQLRALVSDLEAAEDRERRQIARDLHDDLGQTLAAAQVRLACLCSDPRDDVSLPARGVAALIERANASTRSLAAQLAPAVLYELGLTPALEWLGEEIGRTFGLEVSVHDDGRPKPLSQEVRAILFRGVRELVINAAKHAGTDTATIDVARADDQIVIRVADAGVGYDPAGPAAGPRRGLGLVSVGERLSFIGGNLEVRSSAADGTVAVLRAPLSLSSKMIAEKTA